MKIDNVAWLSNLMLIRWFSTQKAEAKWISFHSFFPVTEKLIFCHQQWQYIKSQLAISPSSFQMTFIIQSGVYLFMEKNLFKLSSLVFSKSLLFAQSDFLFRFIASRDSRGGILKNGCQFVIGYEEETLWPS